MARWWDVSSFNSAIDFQVDWWQNGNSGILAALGVISCQ